MTVGELIEALSEMPDYRPVHIPGGEVITVDLRPTTVNLSAGGLDW